MYVYLLWNINVRNLFVYYDSHLNEILIFAIANEHLCLLFNKLERFHPTGTHSQSEATLVDDH